MKTMAARMKAKWQYDLKEVQLPDEPKDGWVLLQISACGVCGTDITSAGEKPEWEAFGHEISAVVKELGKGVTNVKVGQTVALESCSFCGICDLCRDGRVDLCNSKAPHFWGQEAMGFSQFMMAPACCAVPYEGLSAEVAALTECAGVGYDLVKTADIQMGERVAVVGPGPIGLVATALAKHQAPSRLVVIGHSGATKRLQLAQELGAEALAIDNSLADNKELSAQFDHVLMTAPVKFIEPALSLLAYGGKMSYIGIGSGDGRISFDANNFHFRKLQLRSSFASPAIYFPAVLRLLKAGIIPGEKLISHVYNLKDIAQAMKTAREDKATALKIIVKP